jgi:radical SAM enzyme (TIGR01210 family)
VSADTRGTHGIPGGIESVAGSPRLSRSFYHSFIADVMRKLHAEIPPMAPPEWRHPAHVEIRQDYFRGASVKRAVVFLLSNGCEWALRSANGCTMCGHIAKQARTDRPFPPDYFVEQFVRAHASLDFSDVPVLNIYNNGSFFNDNEIPAEARRTILATVSRNPAVKKLLVECRPEFVSEAAIAKAKAILRGKELEVAIGLETEDDYRRTVCINKGFTLAEFMRATRIISAHGVDLKTYVLVKPPFYSEMEAIEDAVGTIRTAFSLGASRVSLEGMTRQRYTLIDYLAQQGRYSLPWLWTLVEIVRRTAHLGQVAVSTFRFYPSPESVPGNCHLCNERVLAAIVRYNETLDVHALDGLDCECRAEWNHVCATEPCGMETLRDFVRTTGDLGSASLPANASPSRPRSVPAQPVAD